MAETVILRSKDGDIKEVKVYTVKEQIKYACQRSKKGETNRFGKELSPFHRGVYLGKAKGLSQGARMAKRGYKVKNIEKSDSDWKIVERKPIKATKKSNKK